MDSQIAIRAAQILTPYEIISPGIVLIKGEKIAAVGSSTQVHIPDGAKLIDVGDKIVVPGFIDTHLHPVVLTYFDMNVDLRGISSTEELQARLRDAARSTAPGACRPASSRSPPGSQTT